MISEVRADQGIHSRVERALRAAGEDAVVVTLRELTSGASGVTLLALMRVGTSDRAVVVKTIPPGRLPTHHRDLQRQVRVLRLLRNSRVPVPEVLAFDPGDPPGVPPFYITEFVAGDSFDPTNVASRAAHGRAIAPGLVAERAVATIRLLGELQRVSPSSLAEPALPLAREISRWQRAFDTTSGSHLLLARSVTSLLRAQVPDEDQATLVHGDFRMGNVIYQDSRPSALLDWEIWSVGDPRLDLAWFIARSCTTHPCRPAADLGFPAANDLLDAYAAITGRRPRDMGWFAALAAYKHAAASALIDKRATGTATRDAGLVVELLRWAESRLSSLTSPGPRRQK